VKMVCEQKLDAEAIIAAYPNKQWIMDSLNINVTFYFSSLTILLGYLSACKFYCVYFVNVTLICIFKNS